MAKSRFYLILGTAVLLLAACSGGKKAEVIAAPNFELKDLSGRTVRLDAYRGHPVLLDFWATWCGPCRMSIPHVQEFYTAHQNEGLVVLGLNMDDDPQGVFGFVKSFKITYPVLLAANSSVAADYELEGIPQFVFIDGKGRVVHLYQGFSMDMIPAWESDLKKSLSSN